MENPSPESSTATPSNTLQKDVLDLLQVMGQSLNMTLLYGINHKVATSSLDISFMVATKFMEYHGPIDFSVEGDVLLINGVSTGGSPVAGSFINRLTGLKLLSFSFQPGFPAGEYRKFFEVLITPPSKLGDQNGASLVQSLGLSHVQASSFSYQRVSAGDASSGPNAPSPVAETSGPVAGPDLTGIASLLLSSNTTLSSQASDDIRQLANDPEKLADLILKAVEAQNGTTPPADEKTLARILDACIQKVVDQLVSDPALKTRKGRKHIKRSLLLLEKSLAGRLQALTDEASAKAMIARLTELAGDLDLEELASQYIKGRRAAGKAGEKLGQLIHRINDDPVQLAELQEQLIRDGLTPEGWQELTGQPPPGGAPASPQIQDLIAETSRQLELLDRLAGQNIARIKKTIGTEDKPRQLSRKEVLEILAELIQEISQPLTIMNGTVALVRSMRVGPLTDAQLELLGMVAESGDRLAQLVDSLMRMAGTPAALNPDQTILDAAYKRE